MVTHQVNSSGPVRNILSSPQKIVIKSNMPQSGQVSFRVIIVSDDIFNWSTDRKWSLNSNDDDIDMIIVIQWII